LLLFGGLFSSSEIVFIVANKAKLQVRARGKKFGAALALSFANSPEEYLTTVLVGNNIANITFSSIAAILLQTYFHWPDMIITIVVAFVILIFGELIPKSLLRVVADAVVSYASFFLNSTRLLLSPLIWVTHQSSQMIVSSLGFEKSNVGRFFHKKDVELLLKESEDVGAVGKEERNKFIKIITLSDVLAKDIMKARTDVVAVDIRTPVRQAWQVLAERGYSRLLVFDQTIDNIIGVVYARDFFSRPRTLSQILQETVFVPETKNCSDLLREFRLKKLSLAVVVDEFGGTAGVVTSEDILEEFLGEISDDQRDLDESVKRLPDGAYLVSGKTEVHKLRSSGFAQIPDGPYDTVAGFIIHALGRIPSEKEECRIGPLRILILRATKTRIELVKMIADGAA
jgi:CBS domain containing-hemolysin-like protein